MSRPFRNALRAVLRKTVVAALCSENPGFRATLFRAFNRTGLLLHARVGREEYVVDTADRVIGGLVFARGGFDIEKLETVFRLLQERGGPLPDVLVDVGANIGPICIPAVARGYVQRALAIEPDPENCRLLRANIALNRLHRRIDVDELALSSEPGDLQLELSDANKGDHRIRTQEESGNRPVVTVSASTLDLVCGALAGARLLVWIDTQGYEGFVLAGARATLESCPPLVIEFWPDGLKRTASFSRLKESIAHYSGYLDLAEPGTFHPIEAIDALYEALLPGERFTDLLVL